jgi:hypothetical protein
MWLYQGKEFDEELIGDNVGFVYMIENVFTKKKYIGKKLFTSTRTKKVKGKTRRRKVKKQSDWLDYYGSNKQLQEDVKQFGKTCFTRTILHLCKTKGTCSYLEMREQVLHGALESENFYNDWIMVKIHRSHLKL